MGEKPPSDPESSPPLGGASEDEITALVDGVLKSGKPRTSNQGGKDRDRAAQQTDRLHARQIARHMQRLAEQLSAEDGGGGPASSSASSGKDEPVADQWFFEIDGKQVGPLPLKRIQFLWQDGLLSPTSLCWRPGFSAWVSLAQVAELAANLAPKPRPGAASPRVTADATTQKQSIPPAPRITVGFATGFAVGAAVTALVAGLGVAGALLTWRWSGEPAELRAPAAKPQVETMAAPPSPPPQPARSPSIEAGALTPTAHPPPRIRAKAKSPNPAPLAAKAENDFDQGFLAAANAPAPEKTQPAPAAKPIADAELPEDLSRQEINSVIAKNQEAIDQCVSEQHSQDPTLTGSLKVRWRIKPSGATFDVATVSPELANAAISTCVKKAIEGWTFPRHIVQGKPVETSFDF